MELEDVMKWAMSPTHEVPDPETGLPTESILQETPFGIHTDTSINPRFEQLRVCHRSSVDGSVLHAHHEDRIEEGRRRMAFADVHNILDGIKFDGFNSAIDAEVQDGVKNVHEAEHIPVVRIINHHLSPDYDAAATTTPKTTRSADSNSELLDLSLGNRETNLTKLRSNRDSPRSSMDSQQHLQALKASSFELGYQMILYHSRKGGPEFRKTLILLWHEAGALYWGPVQAGRVCIGSRRLSVAEMSEVVLGKKSSAFLSETGMGAVDACCLTLRVGEGYDLGELNLEVQSSEVLAAFTLELTAALDYADLQMVEVDMPTDRDWNRAQPKRTIRRFTVLAYTNTAGVVGHGMRTPDTRSKARLLAREHEVPHGYPRSSEKSLSEAPKLSTTSKGSDEATCFDPSPLRRISVTPILSHTFTPRSTRLRDRHNSSQVSVGTLAPWAHENANISVMEEAPRRRFPLQIPARHTQHFSRDASAALVSISKESTLAQGLTLTGYFEGLMGVYAADVCVWYDEVDHCLYVCDPHTRTKSHLGLPLAALNELYMVRPHSYLALPLVVLSCVPMDIRAHYRARSRRSSVPLRPKMLTPASLARSSGKVVVLLSDQFFRFFVCSSKFLNLAGAQLDLAAVSAEQLSELLHGVAALMQRTGYEILRIPTF
jgi:hypothetical protein